MKHQSLLDRIPQVQDLQSASLLLLFCAVPSQTTFSACCTQCPPEYSFRNMTATSRDVWNSCSTQPSQTPHGQWPHCYWLWVGLRSASGGRQVSFWSSWADVLHMVRLRHPAVAETMLEGLNSDDPRHSHIQGAVVARSLCKTWGSVLLSGTLWPTVNVPMGSPMMMMSVHDIAVGNEWQPRTPMVSS